MNKKKTAIFLCLFIFTGGFSGGNDGLASQIYKVGDTGPGGGQIFYVNKAGFTVYMMNPEENYTAHYLEVGRGGNGGTWALCAPCREHGGVCPDSYAPVIPSIHGTETEIGTGRRNTDLILEAEKDALKDYEYRWRTTPSLCRMERHGGKTDWFLPSKDELYELHKVKELLGIRYPSYMETIPWHSGYLFSSTQCEDDSRMVWICDFFDDSPENIDRYFKGVEGVYGPNFRAIRAF